MLGSAVKKMHAHVTTIPGIPTRTRTRGGTSPRGAETRASRSVSIFRSFPFLGSLLIFVVVSNVAAYAGEEEGARGNRERLDKTGRIDTEIAVGLDFFNTSGQLCFANGGQNREKGKRGQRIVNKILAIDSFPHLVPNCSNVLQQRWCGVLRP